MAITEAYSGTASITTTEYSCPNAASYSSGSAITDDGVYQLLLDVNDMVAGDTLQIRLYEKARSGDTQRIAEEWILVGAQACPLWVSPSLILLHGWDFTLDCLAGTSITVNWSVRRVA